MFIYFKKYNEKMKSVEKNLKDMKEKTENKKPKVKPEKQRRRK